jgi:glycosyltransferase involved in cell wall biosynthesis
MKIACVVHRCGDDIAGGSEGHCRLVAEHLAVEHDVTILTTCAKDHVTWQNAYPAGETASGRLRYRRFTVDHPRSMPRFSEISERVFGGDASVAEQEQWFRENGPVSSDLLTFLREHGTEYDRIVFWAFRYANTFFGLPLVADRAVLVPTAEDDLAIRMRVVGALFEQPLGCIFLTPEERALVERWCPKKLPPSCIIGSGLDPVQPISDARLADVGVTQPFVLYLGRVDPNKGCETLLRYFIDAVGDGDVPLVLAGPANMPLPTHRLIKPLGFVDDQLREALLSHASLLAVPSPYESLSLVLLEGWNHGVPALVNGRCDVTRGQTRRANGGLFYRNSSEFAVTLNYLLTHTETARQLGAQGRAYVDAYYRWPRVMATLDAFWQELGPAPS